MSSQNQHQPTRYRDRVTVLYPPVLIEVQTWRVGENDLPFEGQARTTVHAKVSRSAP